jgi:hypothetical protein
MKRPELRGILAIISAVLAVSGVSRADRIELQGGASLRGVVVPGENPDEVQVQTETGSKPVVFAKHQVVRVVRQPSALDTYFARRDTIGDTATAQYEFGLWCQSKKLTGLALNHYRRAVELDKSFGPAHKKLGHVEHKGQWMTYDELREAQGMVKIKGRWISPDARDRLEADAKTRAAQASWARRLKIHYHNLVQGGVDDRQDAEERLEAIRDPDAVVPLFRLFGGDVPSMRVRLAHILGGIPGAEARKALVRFVLDEPETLVRQEAITELVRRKEVETTAEFQAALSDQDPNRVGHAALGLAALGAKPAIPKLIPKLIQYQKRTILVPGGIVAVPGGGGGVANFGTVQPIPVLTGPVVGPGVVAFGVTSVPFTSGTGVAYGGSGGGTMELPPVPQTIVEPVPNADVLTALESLSGRNFGYDLAAWRDWLRTAFRAENPPARRVPEP